MKAGTSYPWYNTFSVGGGGGAIKRNLMYYIEPDVSSQSDWKTFAASAESFEFRASASLNLVSRAFSLALGTRLSFPVPPGDVDNGQRVLVNFAATQKLIMRPKKKVPLTGHVRCRYSEFWARNVARHGEVDLPKSLFD